MLGKGLESLIPRKGSDNPGGQNNGAPSSPSDFTGSAPAQSFSDNPYTNTQPIPLSSNNLPAEPEMLELTTEPEMLELANEPELAELPAEPEVQELPTEPEAMELEQGNLPHQTNQTPQSRFAPPPSQKASEGLGAGQVNPMDNIAPVRPVSQMLAGVKPPTVYADVERAAQERTAEAVFHIEVDRIHPNPHQPRRNFDENAIHDLAASIREFGILQPLVVRKIEIETPNGTAVEYELIAGERRWLASKYLGLEFVPAIIRRVDVERERLEMAIIENLQRENLNPIEMARAFAELQDQFRLTQREIATRLGKSRETVANTVRLLDLPQAVQDAIGKGEISESHGRLLLAVPDPHAQETLFRDLVDKHLTTRELRHRVENVAPVVGVSAHGRRGRPPGSGESSSPELRDLQHRLSTGLGAPVKIMSSASGESGKITITFYSKEELEGILGRLQAGESI